MRPNWMKKLKIPVIAAPMFLVSGPEMVISSCKAGIVGSFPALNTRNDDILDEWLTKIKTSVGDSPFAVNLIVHKTNPRLDTNLEKIVKHKVPLVITSLGAATPVIDAVHSYGGVVFHDVTNEVHAQKAVKAGADGLILVCAGAGGHAGAISPMAFIPRIKSIYKDDVIIVGAGAISNGQGIRAARVLGADFAYMGTQFIATQESMASEGYKEMLLKTPRVGPAPAFTPTVYTDKISGIHANFLHESLVKNGLIQKDMIVIKEGLGNEDWIKEGAEAKAWKDLWSAGHGVLNIDPTGVPTISELVEKLHREYLESRLTE